KRAGTHDVDIGLGEFTVAPLLRSLTAPDLLDLVPLEREGQPSGVLQNVPREWPGQVEMQTQAAFVRAPGLLLQPQQQIYLLGGLPLAEQTFHRLHCARLDLGEAV